MSIVSWIKKRSEKQYKSLISSKQLSDLNRICFFVDSSADVVALSEDLHVFRSVQCIVVTLDALSMALDDNAQCKVFRITSASTKTELTSVVTAIKALTPTAILIRTNGANRFCNSLIRGADIPLRITFGDARCTPRRTIHFIERECSFAQCFPGTP